jgi:C4-dicarboxylate-specific signal transduction histidine kinase
MSPLLEGTWAEATADAMNRTANVTAILLKSRLPKQRMLPRLMKVKKTLIATFLLASTLEKQAAGCQYQNYYKP